MMIGPSLDLHVTLGQLLTAVAGVIASTVSGLLAWVLNRIKRRLDDFLDQWDYVVITSGAAYKVCSAKFPLETGEATTHLMRKRGQTAKTANGSV